MTANQWTPNREPAVFVQMWNGSFGVNPNGLADWWGPSKRAEEYPGSTNFPPDVPRDEGGIDPDYVLGQPRIVPVLDDNVPGPGNGKIDQLEILEALLTDYYNEGFRRIILQLPGGAAFGTQVGGFVQDFTINQWQLLPQWKKDFFNGVAFPGYEVDWLKNWVLARNGVRLNIYLGAPLPMGDCTTCYDSNTGLNGLQGLQVNQVKSIFAVTRPNEAEFVWATACPGVPKAEDYHPWDQRHVNTVAESLKPWIDGDIKGFWLDAGSENRIIGNPKSGRRRGVIELAWMPYFRNQGVRIGAEIFPDRNENADLIDDCAVAYAPWFGLIEIATQFALFPGGSGFPERRFKSGSDWFFDRTKSEVLLGLQRPSRRVVGFESFAEPDFTFNEIGEARARGFVLTLYNFNETRHLEYVKRWYSMGNIWAADLNGDGDVTGDDPLQFTQAFNTTKQMLAAGQPRLIVFATGDANGNGIFEDPADSNYYNLVYQYYLTNYTKVKGNYGTANDK